MCLISRFYGQTKSNGRIRYDNAFKQGVIQMITEQHIPIKEVSKELGVSTDSLRIWLKNYDFDPKAENRDNSQTKKIHELEAKIRSLEKKLEYKDEVISILKKSIGIIYQ